MTCRICKEYTLMVDDSFDDSKMLKYNVRHYAHYECFLKAKGEAGLRALPAWKVGLFPYRLLDKYKLTAVAMEIRSKEIGAQI